jgi:ABC-type branched-subunit amino acid transport system ATPase component/ABC-type branched-subunit amino acid transport system permease subunit
VRLPDRLSARLRAALLPAAAFAALVAVPATLGETQLASLAETVAIAIALLSLNVLLGYAGQISLGQAAFVGTGAFLAVQIGGRGLPLPLAVLTAGLGVGALTALVGLPSLRIRGLAVAIATLVYGIAAQNYLFEQGWFTGADAGLLIQAPLGHAAVYGFFLVSLAFLTATLLLDRQLLRTKFGRALVAVRDAEERAVAFGVEPGPAKLQAYALSGFLAGIAGALIAYLTGGGSAADFGVLRSLELLAFSVVGGVGSRAGVLAAAVLLVGVPNLFPPPDARIAPLLGGLLLIGVILFLPDGLGGLLARMRRRWDSLPAQARTALAGVAALAVGIVLARSASDETSELVLGLALASLAAVVAGVALRRRPPDAKPRPGLRDEGALRSVPRGVSLRVPTRALLEVEAVSVRFGGVQALGDVSLEVRQGEIVGLIGANGAGKSTLFNVVSGFVTPTEGSVRYRGRELLRTAPSQRTALGVGRTFQQMGLLRPETVEDNVLLAQHWLARYPSWAGIARLGGAVPTERELRRRAGLALELFGLEELRGERLGALPYGTMRMVELASAVSTGADLLLFDEATAGLGPEEAHDLADVFLRLRRELGLTLLVIEHHVPMIARTCDYVYALASGRQLAQGRPADVQSNPEVVAEFLGRSTVERADA